MSCPSSAPETVDLNGSLFCCPRGNGNCVPITPDTGCSSIQQPYFEKSADGASLCCPKPNNPTDPKCVPAQMFARWA